MDITNINNSGYVNNTGLMQQRRLRKRAQQQEQNQEQVQEPKRYRARQQLQAQVSNINLEASDFNIEDLKQATEIAKQTLSMLNEDNKNVHQLDPDRVSNLLVDIEL